MNAPVHSTARPRSSLACALALVFALQASACAFDVRDAPEDGAARTEASVDQSDRYRHSPVTYLTSAVASIVYLPAKVLFALGGGLISGVSYVATLGSPQPARSIWHASVDGDYLITPLMIEGGDSVDFVGD